MVLRDPGDQVRVRNRRGLDDFQTVLNVPLHFFEFRGREISALVQDALIDPQFPDVEQHADLAQIGQLLSREPQLTAEAREQHGHLQGVGVARFVRLPHARHELKRAGVADDALHEILHHALHGLDLQPLADPDVVHDRPEHVDRGPKAVISALELLLERYVVINRRSVSAALESGRAWEHRRRLAPRGR